MTHVSPKTLLCKAIVLINSHRVFVGVSLLVAVLSFIYYPSSEFLGETVNEVELFDHFDVDKDGEINRAEFWSLVPHLQKPTTERTRAIASTEYLRICCGFVPLDVHTLRSAELDQLEFLLNDTSLEALLSWTKPETNQFQVHVGDLTTFLPASRDIEVGYVWSLYTPESSPPLRADPPHTEGIQAVLIRLLSSFHSKPFLQTRFQPRGGFAILRARSSTKLDITFRFHAEFQLNDNSKQPFWFTPSQFAGRLVIEADGSHVDFFHVTVPSDKSLNVDMEWTSDTGIDGNDETLTVEIGYMKQMELSSLEPSSTFPRASCGKESSMTIPNIQWEQEISHHTAELQLQKAFFPFKQVEYYNISEALSRAAVEKKYVHSIVLWGALDDQSC
ncbi:selenoprotein N-like [Mizuhopecten yessoensis]|uniref:Selenoprotein N n=1 Tax=Mizuhopecten yessoensis TaxID=6573 RepID=A0A210QFJ6_MIZYE|nr:selenoprotein N-like [Mizuhopecten yessoensis]OWF47391.1 Selenoprotein N [Mizuhopecten yessoensis]